MLRLIYLYRNLTRNKLRALLTCAAVALPIVVYVFSTAVISGINKFLDNSAKQLRLAVVHKASIVNPLSVGHGRKIAALDPTGERLIAVCGLRWIGGKVVDHPGVLSTIGVQSGSFRATFPEIQMSDEQWAQWERDRQAIIVGSATAKQFGWKAGDRISIQASLPPYTDMEFHVISTDAHQMDNLTNWFHLEYFEEEFVKWGGEQAAGWISFFFVKCATAEDLDFFRNAIDALFAGTPDETKTQDEKSFMNEFISQQFNLPRNLTILAAVTVFVAVMAAANTMSMNIRDRTNELATLRSLGFHNTVVAFLVQAESLFLCAVGGLVGAGIPYVLFNHTRMGSMRVPLIQVLEIKPLVCIQAFFIALAIGIVAAAWPAWAASRMTVVHALRNLE
jgi:putative ABC transport system permease protein